METLILAHCLLVLLKKIKENNQILISNFLRKTFLRSYYGFCGSWFAILIFLLLKDFHWEYTS